MKKLFNLIAFTACFTFLAATTTTAQNAVFNGTNCSIRVIAAYGNVAACTTFGTVDVVVPPGQSLLPFPAFFGIIGSKGSYVLSSCVYYVAAPTCIPPYTQTDNVICGAACGNYTAQLFPGFGIAFF